MEVSALRYTGGIGLHGRSPLLRLQSDERLITLIRRGNPAAFEILVSRYHSRLLAFCRHLLGSKEDAEDVLQEVLAAAFNAILADDRPINVRPWLYRIARNRSLNHLRRIQAIGVDSMDIHFSENGASTADKVHDREQFRLLVGDIQSLPETQRTALVLREMDALSYDQIAEAMDTTVPGVKSLLVRARVSLAEAAEARHLSCDEVRLELGEVAEGLRKRPTPLVRRHLRGCRRCESFEDQLKQTNRSLAALLPLGPLALMRKLLIVHLGHGASTGSGATAAGATGATAAGASSATGATAGAGATGLAAGAGGASAIGSAGGLISAGAGALAGKAAASLAAAAIVTAGAVAASHVTHHHHPSVPVAATHQAFAASGGVAPVAAAPEPAVLLGHAAKPKLATLRHHHHHKATTKSTTVANAKASQQTATTTATTTLPGARDKRKGEGKKAKKGEPGRSWTQTDATVLATPPSSTAPDTTASSSTAPDTTSSPPTTTTPDTTTPDTACLPSDASASDPTTTASDPSTTSCDPTPQPALDPGTPPPSTTPPTTVTSTGGPDPSAPTSHISGGAASTSSAPAPSGSGS